jgi:hypothetical protein
VRNVEDRHHSDVRSFWKPFSYFPYNIRRSKYLKTSEKQLKFIKNIEYF